MRTMYGGYSADAIFRIRLPAADTPLGDLSAEHVASVRDFTHKDFKNLGVTQIYAVSDNARRLLVQMGYVDQVKTSGDAVYTGYRPFFIDLDKKEAKPVVP